MTQADVARLTGLTREYVGQIELGKAKPSRATAIAIATVLDCQLGDLFPEMETPAP